jgi:hypothetical protein
MPTSTVSTLIAASVALLMTNACSRTKCQLRVHIAADANARCLLIQDSSHDKFIILSV